MKYIHYKIEENEISENKGEIAEVPADYIKYRATLGAKSVYYKIENQKITDVIGEALTDEAAEREVEDFLSGFNVSLV